MKMDPDDRLAAAAGGAVRLMGDSAGLATDAILQLQESVFAACKKCFRTQTTGKPCEIDLERGEDQIRVEVIVPECAVPDHDKPMWPGIDKVECESRNGSGILRLTKHVAKAAGS